MATRTAPWDVLAALRARPAAMPRALAAADAAVTTHPKTPRPGHARALDCLKAAVLRGVPDPTAAAVLEVPLASLHMRCCITGGCAITGSCRVWAQHRRSDWQGCCVCNGA